MNTTELFRKMQWHVSREVKHYASDFAVDKDSILANVAARRYGQYVWITRDCGTHLIPVGIAADDPDASTDYLRAIRGTWPKHQEYILTLGPAGHDFRKSSQSR